MQSYQLPLVLFPAVFVLVALLIMSRPLAAGGSGMSKSALADLSASIDAVIFMFASLTVK